ncbi:DNA polymerase III subunit alpha [Spiroplasma helicoides]|uniref:DNA-directed DNA polymerase n=1 Tax=Spiroplasma helicoides TaxID=216938 RepID=A0A1B3SLD3_9MOLU|nr:DNA polymerase III subunit alpha [Spiroplasma helicoides]AOG60745.1 DNA polymerase III subunit alpha [Spiroplasma helicoides]
MIYTSLVNVKSCYNFLNSTIKPQDYIDFLKLNNLKVGFYSDKNTMYGAAEFEKLANLNNIKPVIGVSLDFQFGSIIFYAKNNEGYKMVSYVSSFVSNKDSFNEEEVKSEIFRQNLENVIVIYVPNLIAEETIFNQIANLTKNNFYIGITKQNFDKYNKLDNAIFADSIHYLLEEEYLEYKVLISIKDARLINEIDDLEKAFYLNVEQIKMYIDIDKHIKNMEMLVSQVEDEVINNNQIHFLKYPNSKEVPSDNYIESVCYEKLEFEKLNNEEYKTRLNYELEVIKKMGFSDYFLIVGDMVQFAKSKGILVGPGRGSAAGSLVSYLLGITALDPIQWGLLFERFLNIDRVTLPDIDIDFQDNRRDEILEYLFDKYGKNHFATITTFQTIGIKNALRDCGRVFDIAIEEVNQMTKFVSDKNVLDLDKAIKDSKTLQKYKEKYPQIFEVASKIIGLPRQTGTHAAGVVFCDVDLWDVVPTKIGISGILQTQYSMNYLENIGLIKTDILGLRNLSIIDEVIKYIKISRKSSISLDDISLKDPKTFELLRSGETSGIFQLESTGMTDVLIKMNTNSVEDIAVTSSLFRPGPQENIPEYIKRKNSKAKKYAIDENLKDILDSTYGIIVYQEQVMEVLKKIANFSLGKADIVRRAMGKKDAKLMDQFKIEFIENAQKNNYTQSKAEELWHYIERFAEYGFNKSHAIAYSLISYWMAYLKTHYMPEFYCSLLNGVLRNEARTSKYLSELKKYGFKINGPSIKNPNSIYYFSNNMVNIPLNVVKGIGPEFLKTIKQIYKEDKQAFESILGTISKLMGKSLSESRYTALVSVGAFDCFGYSRKVLLEYKEEVLNLANIYDKVHYDKIELDLPTEKDKPEDLARYEKEYLGFYVSAHPLSILRQKIVGNENLYHISNLTQPDQVVDIFVSIENITTKTDKNGGKMCFLTVGDETGEIDVTIFSSVYEKLKIDLSIAQNIIIKIKTQLFNNKLNALLVEFKKVIS